MFLISRGDGITLIARAARTVPGGGWLLPAEAAGRDMAAPPVTGGGQLLSEAAAERGTAAPPCTAVTGGRWRKAEEGCHARGGECARIEAAAVSELPRRGVAEGQSSTTMARRAGERLGGAGGAAVSPGREGRGEEERGGTGERLGGADDAPGPAPAPTACSGREGRGDDGRDGSEPLGDCEPRVMRSSIAAKHAKATGQGVGSSASFLRDMANVEGWIGRIVTRWRLHK
mmetsp:Transcript_48099/g.114480  ORF Transcript_48099/g.114480 Transcript_48099/m.114480 type:complete len:230 (-) Transcript_48099:96-785(-)